MIEKISMYDHAKGIDIEAFTDGYSIDEYGYLYLMSILGHDSAVKAISSGIVSLKDITIQLQHTQRINVSPLELDDEVEVDAPGAAGGAHVSNILSRGNHFSHRNSDRR